MTKKTADFDLKKKYAVLALKWCKKNLGLSERKKRKLILEISTRKRKMKKSYVFGTYCFYRNKIMIYEPNCSTLYDVVSTIIHEYTHYLQSRTQYSRYEKTHFYSTNPLEIEAKNNEKKYTKICFKEIRKLIDNF